MGFAAEYITFHQDLVVGAGVNGLVEIVLVQIIIDVLVAEPASWATSALVLPVIVVVGYV